MVRVLSPADKLLEVCRRLGSWVEPSATARAIMGEAVAKRQRKQTRRLVNKANGAELCRR